MVKYGVVEYGPCLIVCVVSHSPLVVEEWPAVLVDAPVHKSASVSEWTGQQAHQCRYLMQLAWEPRNACMSACQAQYLRLQVNWQMRYLSVVPVSQCPLLRRHMHMQCDSACCCSAAVSADQGVKEQSRSVWLLYSERNFAGCECDLQV